MAASNNQLKRSLSLPLVTLYGLGTIIGAGIYVLIGEVVAASSYLTPAAFLMASLIAAFSAFSYAELSARFPLSAGEAVYVERAFGNRILATSIGLMMVFIGIVASATLVRGFVGYFQLLIGLNSGIIMLLLVFAIGAIAAWGITQSAWLAALTTLVEIGGLLVIIWVARGHLLELPLLIQRALPELIDNGWSSISAGAFIAFFAFIGFEDIVNVAEETQDPKRNLPLAVILSLLIATLLYLVISIVSIASVPVEELAGHPAPLALVFESATGHSPTFMAAISILAIINGTLIMMIMASRILYGMSREKLLATWLGQVNQSTRTPLNSTLLICLLVLLFALGLPVDTLAITTSLFTLIVFFTINLALVVIKLRDPEPSELHLYPIWFPLVGLFCSAAFILSQILAWIN